jgi:LPXTG-site transpeptidase (sortase) family protein
LHFVNGGKSWDSNGGAIKNSANLTVSGCVFTANKALQGAGIYNTDILTVTSSTFSDNDANWGGGIYNNGTADVSNSTFSGNGKNAFGGGIINGGTLTVTNSTFSANSAYGGGGGIRSFGHLLVTDSTFDANEGGGIYSNANATKTVIITRNVFTNNQFSEGAGIHNYGPMVLINNVISGNNGAYGGAIFNQGTLTAEDNTLSNNTSVHGGGIWNEGTLTARNNTLSGNFAINYGGGIYNQASLVVENSTLANNTANDDAGGIFNEGVLTITNSTLAGNNAPYGSIGGLYNNQSVIIRNTILANSGGGADCYNDSPGVVTNLSNLIENNASAPNACGAPLLTGDPNLDSLADNGGAATGPSTDAIAHPLTMSLLTGSPAIDAGDSSVCSAIGGKDQRGVSRPVGSGCDLGALEVDSKPEVVAGSSSPANGAILLASPNQIVVVFNQTMDPASVQDSHNYLLVSSGPNKAIDTLTCKVGLAGDDLQISTGPVGYNAATRTATVTVNGGSPLPNGNYTLFVCGTTSITDIFGLELNLGLSDTTVAFTVNTAASKAAIPVVLPATGFAPAHRSMLPLQPVENRYTNSDLVLEIPSLHVRQSIQGVPLTQDGWDLTWLGEGIGYLEGTPFPTNAGNAVLTGHVYDADGLPGPFINLDRMKWGEQILIHGWGQEYIYEVRSVQERVSRTDTQSLTAREELPWLTLITCQGYDEKSGRYQYRVVVRALLIKIQENP